MAKIFHIGVVNPGNSPAITRDSRLNQRFLGIVFTLLVSSTLHNLSYAGDGKQLYEKNCTGCHGTEIFTRNNRRVQNYQELTRRVRQCSYTLETRWFNNEIKLVSDYLNTNFYKF